MAEDAAKTMVEDKVDNEGDNEVENEVENGPREQHRSQGAAAADEPADGARDNDALELDDEDGDIDEAMRDAVAAVENRRTGDDPDPEATRAELEQLRREVGELRERQVRTLAELENFRKRSDREQRELRRFALMDPLRSFLDVVDNLERALAASGSLDDLKFGVKMIHDQMLELLRQQGVVPVEALECAFDPNVHEAVVREEDPAAEGPTVVEELQRGYKLHDRLLRPARVKVAVPVEGGDAE